MGKFGGLGISLTPLEEFAWTTSNSRQEFVLRGRNRSLCLVFGHGISCFIIPYIQSRKTNRDFRNSDAFLVCAGISSPIPTCLSSFTPNHHPFKADFPGSTGNGLMGGTYLIFWLALFLLSQWWHVHCWCDILHWLVRLALHCVTAVRNCWFDWFPCSKQVVSWFWCLRHGFIHCLSKVAAVPQFSKQLINLKWNWLWWGHIQTKIYARRVGTRVFSYSF